MEDNTMITAKFQADFKRKLSNLLFSYFYPDIQDEDSRELIAMATLGLLLKMLKERAHEIDCLEVLSNDSFSESFKIKAMEKTQNNLANNTNTK